MCQSVRVAQFFYVWWLTDGVFHHYRTETFETADECAGLLTVLGYRGVQVRAGMREQVTA